MFSVVIPSYNRANTIVDALASLWAQDFADFEVIVVDDGSTDDTLRRLEQVGDKRLRVFRQANRGASAARNAGIDQALGTFVAFLDSDDRFLPHHLSGLLLLLQQSPTIVAYTQVIADRGNNRRFLKPFRALRPNENIADYLMCDRGFVQTSGLALDRQVAAAVRYSEDVSFGDDTDFAVRLQLAGCRFLMTSVPSVIWTDTARDDRLSNRRATVGENMRWLEELQPQVPKHAYYGYLGWHHAKNIRPASSRLALRLYSRALVNRSYSPRLAVLIFMQIFLPDRLYRWMADVFIVASAWEGRLFHGKTNLPGDGISARGHLEA